MNNILAGLRIVEGSAFIAAPLAGLTLAQMGADVIRFDPVGGGLDSTRWPITRDGKSLYWAGLNKGKRSIALDIRRPEGRELATALISAPGPEAGIFLTNFPATGWLDYETLKERRNDLIMVNITGNFDGSSAVDYTVNCATGLPFMTGPAGSGEPVNHVLPAWDVATGYLAVNGLLAAERHRRLTGEGQRVQLALSDTAFAAMGNLGFIAEVQVNGEERPAMGNDLFGALGRDFATRDGRRVMIVAITKRQWGALVKATGLEEGFARVEQTLGVDLGKEGDRFRAREEVAGLLKPWCAERTFSEVSDRFNELGVCWGVYRSVGAMVKEDERASTKNPMFEEVDQPGIGRYLTPGSPLEFGEAPRAPVRPAPVLGQHTDEVLASVLGLSDKEIAGLHDKGIVAGKNS
jgi:2-methylfumaryl-CoA isomerase